MTRSGYILVLDDDVDAADALAEAVRAEGYDVEIGFNGEDGLVHMRDRKPDLVLLDIEMPVLDGVATIMAMIRYNRGLEMVPIVLVSGRPDLARIADGVGTPYFLAKPYTYERLCAVVRRALMEAIAPRPTRSDLRIR
jgi:DNA-binding response OmpR family regulator